MDFKEINFYSTPVPIVVVNKGTVEYNHYSCNFDVVLPFNQEDYDKIQRIPYILYFSWEEEYVTVTYHSGIEIVMSKDANCEMIIHNAEGYIIKGLVNDQKPQNYYSKYEEELLSNENILKPWDSREEDKESEEWSISWDTGKESQDDIIDW